MLKFLCGLQYTWKMFSLPFQLGHNSFCYLFQQPATNWYRTVNQLIKLHSTDACKFRKLAWLIHTTRKQTFFGLKESLGRKFIKKYHLTSVMSTFER